MAQYTVEAFRWSGTGYNAQYNTSYSALIDDDDPDLNGSSDNNESVSINGGAFNGTAGPGYTINVSFTDTSNNAHVEPFYFFNTGGAWYFVPAPGSAFTVGATLGNYQSHTSNGWAYSTVTCFVRGTLIDTEHGPIAVEDLKPGVKVRTNDGTYSPLRLALSRTVAAAEIDKNHNLAPVRIMQGALGNGLPARDLRVSRQHRMFVSSKVCERMLGQPSALVSAVKLTQLPGVFVEPDQGDVQYYHLLFDRHEVIFAEGAATESFFCGPEAMKSMSPAALREINAILPDIHKMSFSPEPASLIPSGKLQKKLIARHLKNNQPIHCHA